MRKMHKKNGKKYGIKMLKPLLLLLAGKAFIEQFFH